MRAAPFGLRLHDDVSCWPSNHDRCCSFVISALGSKMDHRQAGEPASRRLCEFGGARPPDADSRLALAIESPSVNPN